jgi:hypothetical protein
MRLRWTFDGRETVFDVAKDTIVIGRAQPGAPVDVDLAADQTVSRRHAAISVDPNGTWIEDLGSRSGTRINGEEIKGGGRRPLVQDATIELGSSVLRPVTGPGSPGVTRSAFATPAEPDASPASRRLALLYELPLEFGAEMKMERLFELIVKRLVDAVPGARRAALLLREAGSGRLLLKAHEPPGTPSISLTIAEHAMTTGEAIVWTRESDLAISQAHVLSAMCAPLLWSGAPLGAVIVDNSEVGNAFEDGDRALRRNGGRASPARGRAAQEGNPARPAAHELLAPRTRTPAGQGEPRPSPARRREVGGHGAVVGHPRLHAPDRRHGLRGRRRHAERLLLGAGGGDLRVRGDC